MSGGGSALYWRSSFKAFLIIRKYFALPFRPQHLLFISCVLQVAPAVSYISLSISYSFHAGKIFLYPALTRGSPPHWRLRNRSRLVPEASLFPEPELTRCHVPSLPLCIILFYQSLHNSFCSCTHFPICSRRTSTVWRLHHQMDSPFSVFMFYLGKEICGNGSPLLCNVKHIP